MTTDALIEKIPEVTAFVDGILEANDCPFKAQMQIDIAIDEIFSNIAQYAYDQKNGKAEVTVEIEEDPRTAVITFADSGRPYDPLSTAVPDTGLSAEERDVGGLGVFLVRKIMDDMSYEYRDGKNILRLKKRIG